MALKILFVDDEEKVLQGIERTLSILDNDWQLSFATSGRCALKMLEAEGSDVIVSDLQMPQMDGASLLAQVQMQHPEMVRIVLSGQANQFATLKSVHAAHQFLAKPCDSETLVASIDRASVIRRLLGDSKLRKVVCKLPNLPSVPKAYDELVKELRKPDVSMDNVCSIVASDVGMSAKALQLVNSAYFGLENQVADVRWATSFLGLNIVGSLVLSTQISSMFPATGIDSERAEALQAHSIAVSATARLMACQAGLPREDVDASAVAGMLHDCGALVIATVAPGEDKRIADRVKYGSSVWDAERKVLGTTHAAIGAYLMGIWGLPMNVVKALANQEAPNLLTGEGPSLSVIIHLADGFINEMEEGSPSKETFLSRVSPGLIESSKGRDFAILFWDWMMLTSSAT